MMTSPLLSTPVFRGLLMQALGSWIPAASVPVVLQAVAFTALHGYDTLGLADILVMGLCMGVMAVKLGGLEAPIALHVVNNLCSFVFASLFTDGSVSGTTDLASFLMSLLAVLLFTAAALAFARKRG